MIDPRCYLCQEHANVAGRCPGSNVDGGDLAAVGGVLACWTPIPAGGAEIDPLSRDMLDTIAPGPEFPGLVGLLSSGPDNITDEGRPATAGIPPAALAEAEPWRGDARTHRSPAGCLQNNRTGLRCRFESSESAGVKSAMSRVADSRGSPMTQPIRLCGRHVVICLCAAAILAAAAATAAGQTAEPGTRNLEQ